MLPQAASQNGYGGKRWGSKIYRYGPTISTAAEFSAVIISVEWLTGCDVVDLNVGWTSWCRGKAVEGRRESGTGRSSDTFQQ